MYLKLEISFLVLICSVIYINKVEQCEAEGNHIRHQPAGLAVAGGSHIRLKRAYAGCPALCLRNLATVHLNPRCVGCRHLVPVDPRYGTWGAWGAWFCREECSHSGVVAYRQRGCTNFMSGYYCKPDPKGRGKWDRARCRQGKVSLCRKAWSAWGDWSACSATCGEDTRIRKRKCQGFGQACVGKEAEYNPCIIQRPCPLIDGKWSEWGRWDLECSVTCGDGVRQRVRKCNNPAPSGKGRTCEGDKAQTEPCHIKVVCPIHGGWAEWAPWACDATCNGTVAQRGRLCDNPEPQFGGKACVGEPRELKDGCNSFSCPLAPKETQLPQYILDTINSILNQTNFDFKVKEGDSVTLPCKNNATSQLKAKFPDMSLEWLKNGKPMALDPKRMAYNRDTVYIKHAKPEDNGVYLCQVNYIKNAKVTVDVFAVSVNTTKVNVTAKATKELDLTCNSASLGVLYPKAKQAWYHNKTKRVDFGMKPPQTVNSYRIDEAKFSDTGTWTCKVEDPPTGRSWDTNKVLVQVGPPPEWYEAMMNPYAIGGIVAGVVLLLVVFLAYCQWRAKKMDAKAESDAKEMQEQLSKVQGGKPDQVMQKPSRLRTPTPSVKSSKTGTSTPNGSGSRFSTPAASIVSITPGMVTRSGAVLQNVPQQNNNNSRANARDMYMQSRTRSLPHLTMPAADHKRSRAKRSNLMLFTVPGQCCTPTLRSSSERTKRHSYYSIPVDGF